MIVHNSKKVITLILMIAFCLAACGKKEPEVINIDLGIEEPSVSTENDNDLNGDVSIDDVSYNPLDTYADYRGESYTEFRNIDVHQLENIKKNAVIYYQANPEEYNMPVDCQIDFGEITVDTSTSEKIITLPVTMSLEELYSSENIKYSGVITPSIEFADDYTGGLLYARDTKGNDGYNYGITFKSNEEEYTINYKCNVSVERGEYRESVDKNFVRPVKFIANYEIRCPLDYDGLLIKVTPMSEYRELVLEENDTTTHLLDEELAEDVLFMRIQ